MRNIEVDLSYTIDTRGLTAEESEQAARSVAEWLVAANQSDLPSQDLRDSGVRFRAEASETYATARVCLARGYADAMEIAVWRCAELRAAGVDAKPMLVRHPAGDAPGIFYYTVVVLLPDGTVEDPVEAIRKVR